jgi:hypothetical protein
MKDEERAAMVIAMSVGLRKEAAAAVDGRLWERSMDIIKNHSGHAARCDVDCMARQPAACDSCNSQCSFERSRLGMQSRVSHSVNCSLSQQQHACAPRLHTLEPEALTNGAVFVVDHIACCTVHTHHGYLTSMDMDDAAGEFLGWGTFQQVDTQCCTS